MPSRYVVAACVLNAVMSFGQVFSQDDPIRKKLDEAIREYKTKTKGLEKEVVEALNKIEDAIRSKKNVIREQLELVKNERDAFVDSGEWPQNTLKNRGLLKKLNDAKKAIADAFDKASNEYLRMKQDQKEKELKSELETLLKSNPPLEPNAMRLFDGKTLDGWEPQNGDLAYMVDRGHLVCVKTMNGRLQTKKAYSNFSLRLEYQFPYGIPLSDHHGTGILLSSNGSGNNVKGLEAKGAIEYQLKPGESGRLNVLFGKGASNPGLPRKNVEERQTGLWNKVEIRFEGNNLTYFLNGEQVNQATLDFPIETFIALRNGSQIRFRSVRIISPPPK